MTVGAGIHVFDEATYHRDPLDAPSLSSSMARLLLSRSPLHVWTNHPRLNPKWTPPDGATRFDFGSAVHMLVLGRGPELSIVNADNYTTKAAREARDEARHGGLIPILTADHQRAQDMASAFFTQLAMLEDEDVIRLFSPDGGGRSERTIAWQEGDQWCRGRPDRMIESGAGLVAFADYKTTTRSAHPAAVSRAIFDLGADFQWAFYDRGFRALEKNPVQHWLITQETEPPFALSVTTLSPAAKAIAASKVATAIRMWNTCMASDYWPSYPRKVAELDVPSWVENDWIDRRDAIVAGLPDGMTILDGG